MKTYTKEFKQTLVKLAESGHSTKDLAKEYGVSKSTINTWRRAYKSQGEESFFKTIKYEELNHHSFHSFQQLYKCVDSYIQWYNTKRIHEGIDYDTPMEREIKIRNKFKQAA